MDLVTILAILLSSLLWFAAVTVGCFLLAPYFDHFSKNFVGTAGQRFEQLGLGTERLKNMLRAWGLTLVICLVGGYWLGILPIALAVAWLVMLAPQVILKYLIKQREQLLRDQMVGASMALANSVKAGLTMSQGLESIAEEIPSPLREEFRRIVFEYNRGRPLRDAIREVGDRLQLDAYSLFANAAEVALERGGRVNEALERISHSLQETQRLERKLEADTSAGRQLILILTIFPVAFLGLFYFLEPNGVTLLFTTFLGQVVIVAAMFLIYGGSRWANKILDIDF